MLWTAAWKQNTPHQLSWLSIREWYKSRAVHRKSSTCRRSQSRVDTKFHAWLTMEMDLLITLIHIQREKQTREYSFICSWWQCDAEPVWHIQSCQLTTFDNFSCHINSWKQWTKGAFMSWVWLEEVWRGCQIFSWEKIRCSMQNSCSALKDVWHQ